MQSPFKEAAFLFYTLGAKTILWSICIAGRIMRVVSSKVSQVSHDTLSGVPCKAYMAHCAEYGFANVILSSDLIGYLTRFYKTF